MEAQRVDQDVSLAAFDLLAADHLRKPRERDITLGLPSEAYGKLQKGIAGQSSEQFAVSTPIDSIVRRKEKPPTVGRRGSVACQDRLSDHG
jgi:hypothetical protein